MTAATTTWGHSTATSKFRETITYDGNGNIKTYFRNGPGEGAFFQSMDQMTYNYNTAVDPVSGGTYLLNNRLGHIDDLVSAAQYNSSGIDDIDDQNANNYTYDKIGNLIGDVQSGFTSVEWTVYGKIKKITKSNTAIEYKYDPSGNRTTIEVTVSGSTTQTWYVRDAQGNTLGVYSDNGSPTARLWKEQSLYGSNRLGIWAPEVDVTSVSGSTVWNTVGKTFYELPNHLGNVLATISDKKIGHDDGSGVIDYYDAEVINQTEYYPFGMQMPGRKYTITNGSRYRYGFNGKENDNDVKGEGFQQDYGMRIYDPRIGKFLSVDPISKQYPQLTPYQFAGNMPIWAIDLDGLEPVLVSIYTPAKSRPVLKPTQWYVLTRGAGDYETEGNSYDAAARYNVEHSNPGAYNSIGLRSEWYRWAARQQKDNIWFAAAAVVTSPTMVGAADEVNLGFMTDQEESILRGANKFLLQENFRNFGSYALGKGPVTWNGKSFGHLSGPALDDQMVVIEMTVLQGYLDNYKKDYTRKNGEKAWNDLSEGLNGLFTGFLAQRVSPGASKYAQNEFKKKYGKDAIFDFMNLEHRIFQGQKMAEFLRKEAENKTPKDKN